MPFKSKAQRGYLFANKPEVAKKFAKKTPKGKKLPNYVKEASPGRLLTQVARQSRKTYSPTDILAHELGHLKAFSKGPQILVKPRMLAYGRGPGIAQIAALAARPAKGKFMADRAAIQAAGYLPRLVEEAAATYYGLKAMKKLNYISPTLYRKARSNLLKAYGTYATDAAVGTLMTGASGLAPSNALVSQFLIANTAHKLVRPRLIRPISKSLHRGLGKGGVSSRKEREELAKLMGLKNAPVFAEMRGFGGSARPGKLVSKKYVSQLRRAGVKPSAIRKARQGGLVTITSAPKSKLTGKKTFGDKFLDTLEAIGSVMP